MSEQVLSSKYDLDHIGTTLTYEDINTIENRSHISSIVNSGFAFDFNMLDNKIDMIAHHWESKIFDTENVDCGVFPDEIMSTNRFDKSSHYSKLVQDNYTFIADTEWDGVVLELKSNDTIVARVWDVEHGQDGGEEIFDVLLDKVKVIGRDLCREGAIFRWSFGFIRVDRGSKLKHSRIVFRRIPLWNKNEVDHVRALAEQRVKYLSER